MFDYKLFNLEKKAIILALTQFSKSLNFVRVKTSDNNAKYIINTNKKKLMEIEFSEEDDDDDFLSKLSQIIEYIYNEFDFLLDHNINNDFDILSLVAKINNGLIQNCINLDNEFYDNNPLWMYPTNELSRHLTFKRIEIANIMITNNDLSDKEKQCLLIVKLLIDNVIQESVFTDSYDLRNFLKTSTLISQFLPLFEEEELNINSIFNQLLSLPQEDC